jgi:hypothetical protein
MRPILKRVKVDTETKKEEKEEIYKLMKVAGLEMDMPKKKERITVLEWIFIIVILWLGGWFVYKVLTAFERGELI